jgi:hypothetical protein
VPPNLEFPIGKTQAFDFQRHTTSVVLDAELRIAKTRLAKLPKPRQEQILANCANSRDVIRAVGAPAENTATEYRKRGAFLWDQNAAYHSFGPWHVWMILTQRCGSKASWYASRSALLFFLIEELKKRKRAIEAWWKAPEEKRPEQRVLDILCMEAAGFSEALEALPPPGFLPDKFSEPDSPRPNSHSKSGSIQGRPLDWRLAVAAQLKPRLRLLYLLQCVSGCRPVELDAKHGVTARLTPEGHLVVTTVGAKLSETAGQDVRELTFEKPTGLASRLITSMAGATSVSSQLLLKSLVKNGKVENYRAVVATAGERAFPTPKKGGALKAREKKSQRLTAYSARHQFKADLVAAGWEPDAIAMAMGHRTERSAVYYARRGASSSGGVAPTKATATHPAIKKRSAPPAARAVTNPTAPTKAVSPAKARVRGPKP